MLCFRGRKNIESESIITLRNQVEELERKLDINNDGIVTKNELEQRLSQVSNQIDSNSDGIISREELQKYIQDNFAIYNNKIKELDSELKEKDKIIKELQKELQIKNQNIEHLQDEIYTVEQDKDKCLHNLVKVRENKLDITQVSHSAIKKYVKDSLRTTKHNNKHIPDFLEGPMEETVIKIILHILAQACDEANINIFNHKIGLSLLPNE